MNIEDRLAKECPWLYRGAKFKIILRFIKSLLHSHNEELIQRIEGMKVPESKSLNLFKYRQQGYNKAIDRIINHIKNDQQ